MENPKTQLDWIQTTSGGPLILLGEHLLIHWSGNEDPVLRDFDRACEAGDYSKLIDVGPGKGLILGDESLPAAWCPDSKPNGGILVRWMHAENDAAAVQAMNALPNNVEWEWSDGTLDLLTGKAVLFDAICPGSNTDCMRLTHPELFGSRLTIDLATGAYSVGTFHYRPDADTYLILHRLSRA